MIQSVKTQWIDALRSGEYRQGSGALERGGRFCCLGVLCDLALKAGEVVSDGTDDDGKIQFVAKDDINTDELPRPVAIWAGLDDVNPDVTIGESQAKADLAGLNDGGMSFADLADLIEACL